MCLVAVLAWPARAAEPFAVIETRPHVPQNLQASNQILHLVARMAQGSPTFRAQCSRIMRATNVVVRMRYAGVREDRPYNARTVVRHHEFGAMIAEVELYAPLDPVEVIAHEFEHLVEQIQGHDLRKLARVKGSGVVELRRGEFETTRAVAAGRRVLAEFSDTSRPSTPDDTTPGP